MNYPKPKWSKIKPCLFLCLINCFYLASTFGQSTFKGASISNTIDTGKKGNTWAVIVGISKYQNVQGLNYADKDALAFYDYLVNKKGIDKEHIQLLINEKAIASDIYGALDWLDLSVKENDRVIFYFSGHGDVETKTIHQNGFLLANDAPIAAYMTKGTIGVNYLQDYLETYVAKRKVKDVLLIVDACRAGKLAGGTEGIQITMHALGQNWNNQIIKVLSAQEGESSFEDKKWGGGRGVFSYYLVKGLEGLANRNADSVITTAELAAYLPFAVGDATNSVQNPTVSGNPKTSLFSFNKELLALANTPETQSQTSQLLAARGNYDELDPEIANWYSQYRTYLQKGRLIWGEKQTDTINCAKYYYLKLVDDDRAKKLIPSLKSSFIMSLKHKYELQLNDFINENFNTIYNYPDYLEAEKEIKYAFSLVDTSYILYNYLKARTLFTNGRRYGSHKHISELKKIIQIEPDASYAYNRLGYRYMSIHLIDSAIFYFKKAITFSPTWANTFTILGVYLNKQNNYSDAIFYLEKGLKLDSTKANLYITLATAYNKLTGNNKKGDSILNRGIDIILRQTQKGGFDLKYYTDLSDLYKGKGDNENANNYLNKVTKIAPKNYRDYDLIADAYISLKDYKKAIKTLNEGIEEWPLSDFLLESIANFYYDRMDYDNYVLTCNKLLKMTPELPLRYYNMACAYSLRNETKKSLYYWNAFLVLCVNNNLYEFNDVIELINDDNDLINVKKQPEFSELLTKYFSSKAKH